MSGQVIADERGGSSPFIVSVTPAGAFLRVLLIAAFCGTGLFCGMFAAIWAFWTFPADEAHQIVGRWTIYTASVLSADYAGLGWVRRGLGGTLAVSLGDDWVSRVLRLHLLSLALLLPPLVLLLKRLRHAVDAPTLVFMAMFILFSPQTFLSWRNDIGRTDVLCIAMVAWSFVLAIDGRWKAAAPILAASVLLHETGVIFGLPMLATVAVRQLAEEKVELASLAAAAAIFGVVAGACIAGPALFGPTPHEVVRYMQHHAPYVTEPDLNDLRDCAIYMLAASGQGLRTAICYNASLPLYRVMVLTSLALVLVNSYALGLLPSRPIPVLAALASIAVMNLVANDTGRWVSFATTGLWLMSAWAQLEGLRLGDARVAWGALALLFLISLGSGNVHIVNHAAEHLGGMIGYAPFPSVGSWMTRCDPSWRSFVAQ